MPPPRLHPTRPPAVVAIEQCAGADRGADVLDCGGDGLFSEASYVSTEQWIERLISQTNPENPATTTMENCRQKFDRTLFKVAISYFSTPVILVTPITGGPEVTRPSRKRLARCEWLAQDQPARR